MYSVDLSLGPVPNPSYLHLASLLPLSKGRSSLSPSSKLKVPFILGTDTQQTQSGEILLIGQNVHLLGPIEGHLFRI